MHGLDEGVLGDHEAAFELSGVVLDPAREAAPLELPEQAELAGLRESHRSRPGGRQRRGQRG